MERERITHKEIWGRLGKGVVWEEENMAVGAEEEKKRGMREIILVYWVLRNGYGYQCGTYAK